ncbi:MAG: hypothetical protein DMF97_13775 [Acidobacteria bacterium]|nr:MAG: hypothetical protein DMF97_13775 [Acidobacteriota bacterium]
MPWLVTIALTLAASGLLSATDQWPRFRLFRMVRTAIDWPSRSRPSRFPRLAPGSVRRRSFTTGC